MCPSSDQSAYQESGYSYPGGTPEDLEAALTRALSTKSQIVDRDLGIAMLKFVSMLKEKGEPPENVLIAVKTVLHRHIPAHSRNPTSALELQQVVVRAAVLAYFGDPPSAPSPVTGPTRPRPGRAASLISRILAAGEVTRERMARELNVSVETLEAYEMAREPIPLNRQARLALFVIANLPSFLKDGNRLRQQVAAAIAFETHQTKTHDGPPENTLRFPTAAGGG